MSAQAMNLEALGWRPVFAAQLQPDEDAAGLLPGRIFALERSRIVVEGPGLPRLLRPPPGVVDLAETLAVGDWIVADPAAERIVRVLDRAGVFVRRAAGTDRRVQLIAANVDTLFIVTSADRDFNLARLERYLAVALEGGASPVVVVTKADTHPDPEGLAAEAMRLAVGLVAVPVDARSGDAVAKLAPWCGRGQTVALAGSSGVGKSTLVNTLTGAGQATRAAREHDQRGRHTTTRRSMHHTAGGAWLIDTPGMRSLGLVDADSGLEQVFDDIGVLAAACRFADCRHESEPGCAVQAAIADGRLAPERLGRYRKLEAENRHNRETVAERRARFKAFGRFARSVQQAKADRRKPS